MKEGRVFEQCIRCDEELDVTDPLENYKALIYNHGGGELPICHDCFEEVRGRNLTWR
jgi:hypothetical protein